MFMLKISKLIKWTLVPFWFHREDFLLRPKQLQTYSTPRARHSTILQKGHESDDYPSTVLQESFLSFTVGAEVLGVRTGVSAKTLAHGCKKILYQKFVIKEKKRGKVEKGQRIGKPLHLCWKVPVGGVCKGRLVQIETRGSP